MVPGLLPLRKVNNINYIDCSNKTLEEGVIVVEYKGRLIPKEDIKNLDLNLLEYIIFQSDQDGNGYVMETDMMK